MRRVGGMTVVCGLAIVLGAAAGAAPGAVATRGAPAFAQTARELGARILHAMHSSGPPPRARCCGTWKVTALYSAAAGPLAPYGAYKLAVSTRRNAIEGVTIEEFPTLGPTFRPGGSGPMYRLSIGRAAGAPGGKWSALVAYSDTACPPSATTPGVPPPFCKGHPTRATLTEREGLRSLRPLAAQALGVIERARRHGSIANEDPTALRAVQARALGGGRGGAEAQGVPAAAGRRGRGRP